MKNTIKNIALHYAVYCIVGILAGALFATATPSMAAQTAITVALMSLALGTIALIVKW